MQEASKQLADYNVYRKLEGDPTPIFKGEIST